MIGLEDSSEGIESSIHMLKEVLSESPAGPTPICRHIELIAYEIAQIEGTLRANLQKAAIIITTDGECSDGSVADALKPLRNVSCCVCELLISHLNILTDSVSIATCYGDHSAVYR